MDRGALNPDLVPLLLQLAEGVLANSAAETVLRAFELLDEALDVRWDLHDAAFCVVDAVDQLGVLVVDP